VLVSQPHWAIQVLCWIELVLLVILGVEIIIYADLAKVDSHRMFSRIGQ
jgi:hypothetical protein